MTEQTPITDRTIGEYLEPLARRTPIPAAAASPAWSALWAPRSARW